MAWTDIPATDTDVDSPLDEDLFDALRDNQLECRTAHYQVDISEGTASDSSFTTIKTVTIYVPDLADYTGIQRKVIGEFEAKITAGTATYRLLGDGNTGTEVTSTATSFESVECEVDIDAGSAGSVVTVQLQGKSDITPDVRTHKAEDRITWRTVY